MSLIMQLMIPELSMDGRFWMVCNTQDGVCENVDLHVTGAILQWDNASLMVTSWAIMQPTGFSILINIFVSW